MPNFDYKQIAFEIIRDIGITPMEVDNGVTLDFEYSKAIAIKMVKLLLKEQQGWQNGEVNPVKHWELVLQEIHKASI